MSNILPYYFWCSKLFILILCFFLNWLLEVETNHIDKDISLFHIITFLNGCEEIENLFNMSRRGSWITLKFRSVVDVIHASKYQLSYGGIQRNNRSMSPTRVESGHWISPGLQFFSTNTNTNANGVKNVKVQPQAPASTTFNFPSWLKWVLGSVLSLLLPFWKYNWGKLQRIEGEAEVVVEEVEKVASAVEKVAKVAEKVSEDVAEMLPEDGKLKKVVLVVEHASEQVAHDAQLTEEFIHKVEELKNDLDDLESFVEPVIEKVVKKELPEKK